MVNPLDCTPHSHLGLRSVLLQHLELPDFILEALVLGSQLLIYFYQCLVFLPAMGTKINRDDETTSWVILESDFEFVLGARHWRKSEQIRLCATEKCALFAVAGYDKKDNKKRNPADEDTMKMRHLNPSMDVVPQIY